MALFCAAVKRDSGGARGVMIIVVGNGHGDTSSNPAFHIVQILHFTFHISHSLNPAFHTSSNHCISHSANTLEKGMSPIILRPAMGK